MAPGPPLNFKVGLLRADGGPRRFLFPYFLKAEAVMGLAADDPAALAQFYGALLGVAPQPGLSSTHWRVPWPAGGWLLGPEGNRLLLLVTPSP